MKYEFKFGEDCSCWNTYSRDSIHYATMDISDEIELEIVAMEILEDQYNNYDGWEWMKNPKKRKLIIREAGKEKEYSLDWELDFVPDFTVYAD